jgi:hypothetical protein
MLEIDIFFIISLLLLFTGFISGILAGFFGIGGGIIIVPVIYHLFNFLDFSQNISMHMAIGTSLATIIIPPPIPKKPAKIPDMNPVNNKRREIIKKISISNII